MVLATTIPVFSIVVRYNLMQSNIHKGWANIFAVALPWIVVIPFLTGNGLNEILSWGTLFFTSVANFIIPFAIYIKACKFKQNPNDLTENQKRILIDIGLKTPLLLGSLNERDEVLQLYQVLPDNSYVSSRSIAIFSLVVLSALTLSSIGLNITGLV